MTSALGLDVRPEPVVINTSRGAVEYASFGSGPAVLCLHGAMGGYDQGLLLVVHGSADPLVPFESHAAVFAKRIPGAKLLVLDGGEHAAIFTHRHQAKAEVTAFLAPNAHGFRSGP
jgi:fermentation-respiration switch protein FrsA (DUF1100 family)